VNYIKVFEERDKQEELKEYFNDKINWKAFNFLLQKITQFEDMGYRIALRICLRNPEHQSGHFDMYTYNTDINKGEYTTGRFYDFKDIVEYYNNDKTIYYKISLHDEVKQKKAIMDAIYDEIKNKFEMTDGYFSLGIGYFKERK